MQFPEFLICSPNPLKSRIMILQEHHSGENVLNVLHKIKHSISTLQDSVKSFSNILFVDFQYFHRIFCTAAWTKRFQIPRHDNIRSVRIKHQYSASAQNSSLNLSLKILRETNHSEIRWLLIIENILSEPKEISISMQEIRYKINQIYFWDNANGSDSSFNFRFYVTPCMAMT